MIISESGNRTVIDIITEDYCTEDVCSYIFSSDNITTSYYVEVDVIGCTTDIYDTDNSTSCKILYSVLINVLVERFYLTLCSHVLYIHLYTVCAPSDLLSSSGVNISDVSNITLTSNGDGFISFPGGNVTFNGVSLESTAIYRTTIDHRVNNATVFESICMNNMWTPSVIIISAGIYYVHSMYAYSD